MTYACEDCCFLFRRLGEMEKCPLCEKNHIRPATEEEARSLEGLLEQSRPALEEKAHKPAR